MLVRPAWHGLCRCAIQVCALGSCDAPVVSARFYKTDLALLHKLPGGGTVFAVRDLNRRAHSFSKFQAKGYSYDRTRRLRIVWCTCVCACVSTLFTLRMAGVCLCSFVQPRVHITRSTVGVVCSERRLYPICELAAQPLALHASGRPNTASSIGQWQRVRDSSCAALPLFCLPCQQRFRAMLPAPCVQHSMS